MDIKIGVQDSPREITFESNDSVAEVTAAVEQAIAKGSLLSLVDDRGRAILVPGAKIAYVEIGPATRGKVGFGTNI